MLPLKNPSASKTQGRVQVSKFGAVVPVLSLLFAPPFPPFPCLETAPEISTGLELSIVSFSVESRANKLGVWGALQDSILDRLILTDWLYELIL